VGGGSTSREALYLYRLRTRAMRRALTKAKERGLNSEGINILEFGCGSGYWLETLPALLDSKDFAYTGADISATAVDRLAKDHSGRSFVCLNDVDDGWNRLGKTSPYDLTLAIDVLYHVTDDSVWRNSLRNMASVTAPGGYMIFSDYGYQEAKPNPSTSHVKHRPMQAYLDELEATQMDVISVVPKFFLFNRIKYGPWRDHGAASAMLWRIADRLTPVMHLLYLVDCLVTPFMRPMDTRCKTRFFVCQKRASVNE
jgi:SAM-dependent methyltransferase